MLQQVVLIVAGIAPAFHGAVLRVEPEHGHMRWGNLRSVLVQKRSNSAAERHREAPNLAEYCAGGGAGGLQEKDRVVANWKGYGTYYPGVVDAANNDGTMDIAYDDGWTEQGLPAGSVKPAPSEKENTEKRAKDDAACELANDVEDIKEKVQEANQNVAVYLAGQRALATGKQALPAGKQSQVPSEPVSSAPAPAVSGMVAAPAPAEPEKNEDQDEELKKLKSELDEVNSQIAEEEAAISTNEAAIKDLEDHPPASIEPVVKTVDDLILEYRARLKERREVLRRLREKRALQEQKMAALGGNSVSLEVIASSVKAVMADLDTIRAKRDKLAREQRLDAELHLAIDMLISFGANLQAKVDRLVEAQEKADAKMRALQAAKLSAARLAAQGDVKDAEEAVAAVKVAEKAVEEAEEEAFVAGEEVETNLKDVTKETGVLDTGIHPNGEKWWRYRYEHAFVEGGVMIMISFLMIAYERLFNYLRNIVYERSRMKGTEGTLYTRWLEFTSLQMLACLVMFLTVWLLDRVHVFDILARHVHTHQIAHLPRTGAHWRIMAFDLCIVLIVAMLLYFMTMLSIVHWSIKKMQEWAESQVQDMSRFQDSPELSMTGSASINQAQALLRKGTGTLSLSGSADDFLIRKTFFLLKIEKHPAILAKLRSVASKKNMSHEELLHTFPFWKYLRMNVRSMIDELLELSTPLWTYVALTFLVLMFLHLYLHIGYIRVMGFFLVVNCVTLGLGMLMIVQANKAVEQEMSTKTPRDITSPREGEVQTASSAGMQKAYIIKHAVVSLLQYTLFLLCYGAGRSICQPWMWELHFWLVLGITILTIVLSAVFVIAIAPVMTNFAASMAMPPYIDASNVASMEEVIDDLKSETMTASQFMAIGK